MTSPILITLFCLTFALAATAQDAQEQAIILNQELQFLEESVRPSQVTSLEGSTTEPASAPSRPGAGETPSLERIYFGDETDSISSRVAAPKRKARGN